MLCIPSIAIQGVDMSQVFVELKECLALEMAHGRRQTIATEVNQTISSIPLRISLQKAIGSKFSLQYIAKNNWYQFIQ